MTEQTKTEIPDYAHGMRIAAAGHAAKVTTYTVREKHLSAELDRFREHATAERARIEAELNEARAKADAQLTALTEQEQVISRDLREAGMNKARHQRDAAGAERSWLDWCAREGVDPRAVPPLQPAQAETSQPLPLAAPPAPSSPLAPANGVPAWMVEQDRIEDDEDRTRDDARVHRGDPLETRHDLTGGAPDGEPFRSTDGGGSDA